MNEFVEWLLAPGWTLELEPERAVTPYDSCIGYSVTRKGELFSSGTEVGWLGNPQARDLCFAHFARVNFGI